MKSTKILRVIVNLVQKINEVFIHPNDGLDIDLMHDKYQVKIFNLSDESDFSPESEEFLEGEIALKNECQTGTIEMGKKYWRQIGKPKEVKILYGDNNLLIIK